MNQLLSPTERQLENDVLATLAEHAQPHIDRDPRLSLIEPFDLDRHVGQRLYTFCVESTPTEPDGIDFLGGLVMSNYRELSEDLQHGDQSEALLEAGDFMDSGGTVMVATSHEGLVDPAEAAGTMISALRRQGYEFEAGIGLFKMLPLLQYKFTSKMDPIPCMDVVGQIFDRAYLSITRSETVRKSGLMEQNEVMPVYADYFNSLVKQSIDRWQTDGGVLIAEAPSASTHKWNAERTRCVMPRVTTGTAKMMAHPNTRVLPVNFDLDANGGAYLEIRGGLRQLKDPEEVHAVMEDMAAGFNKRSAEAGNGRPYEYAQAA